MTQKRGWHNRGLVSLLTLVGFLIMGLTGLVLFMVPQGRVAYWTDWHLLGLTKTQWGDVHIISALLFVVAGALHIYFNWKPLVRYLYDRTRKIVTLKKEIGLSVALGLLLVVSGILRLPPLSYLLVLNDKVKASWITSPAHEPPFGHAEEVSLRGLSRKMRFPLDQALSTLAARGVRVSGANAKLMDIARDNGSSPMAVYGLIQHLEQPGAGKPAAKAAGKLSVADVEARFAGTGIGRMTLPEVARRTGVPIKTLRERLARAGRSIADDQPLRQAAGAAGVTPLELLKTMLVTE